ncbi:CvpA family protein [Pontivivens insulae]|uniref:Colicin V production protein n=1 Tax=Pontivivens insulae TaxID=1639689 RepID=A0A2R8ABS3_9RHOB|nr:CvpA family protein [Pontivivens insulae]RED11317.1 membrane protein required for colicin V production [Pontivivens insulae]SPF29510.1 hypothetical protein POI8812_01821 [Pontivivens insulae]
MENFTLVDGGVAAVVLISALLAYSRGLVREIMSIAGWVIAAVAAFYFAGQVEPIIAELPVVRDIVGGSCQLSILAAFAVVFIIALVIVSMFTPLLAGSIQNSSLGSIDSGLGLLFGLARGLLLVAVAFIIFDMTPMANDGIAMVENAASRDFIASLQETLSSYIPTEMPPQITDSYEQLMGRCSE